MGEEAKLEEEELETSEEEVVEGDDADDLETEDAAEPDEALKESEEEEESEPPADIPYARFAAEVAKAKKGEEYETKLDQFKRLGAEGYYQLYPDEKPEGDPEPEPEPEGAMSMSDMANHRIAGGDHDGKTLGELAETDILAALDIYNGYRAEQDKVAKTDAQRREESDREIKSFASARAKEAFGKDVDDLTDDQAAQVEELVGAVTKWMVETGRGGGIVEDGFFLMNKENLFEKAQTETLKDIVAMLKEPGTPSISTAKTTQTTGGYGRFLNMTASEAAAEMDKLTDDEQEEFLKKAPAEVRKKFPKLPWEDA